MSIISFKCEKEKKESVKEKVWEILRNHYFTTVSPNTRVKYEYEGDDVYLKRLDELMRDELCKIEDTAEGICVEFDSTEDAGFSIADEVYGTGMGYCDDGLTYLKPMFEKIIKELPDICFEAHCECDDKWVSEEYDCSYDGENFFSESDEDEDFDWE